MRVALGVCGGVAAYKAAELVRRLQQEGIDVQVVMTGSAQEFVTPLTFAALTGQKVITEMFGTESGGAKWGERVRQNGGRAADRLAGRGARHSERHCENGARRRG